MGKATQIIENLKIGKRKIEVFKRYATVGIACLAALGTQGITASDGNRFIKTNAFLSNHADNVRTAQDELKKMSMYFDDSPIKMDVYEGEDGSTPMARMDHKNNSCTVHVNGIDMLTMYFYDHMDSDLSSSVVNMQEKLRYFIVAHEAGHCFDMLSKKDSAFANQLVDSVAYSLKTNSEYQEGSPEFKKEVLSLISTLYGESVADAYASMAMVDLYRDNGEDPAEAVLIVNEISRIREQYKAVDGIHDTSDVLSEIDPTVDKFQAGSEVVKNIAGVVNNAVGQISEHYATRTSMRVSMQEASDAGIAIKDSYPKGSFSAAGDHSDTPTNASK